MANCNLSHVICDAIRWFKFTVKFKLKPPYSLMREKLRSLHALHCPFQINHWALERVASVILTPPDLNLIDMYFLVHFIFLLYSYYSDPSRKYLVVELPPTLTDKKGQKEVLLSSFELAYVLNRTLILPAFNCPNTVTKHCKLPDSFSKDTILS